MNESNPKQINIKLSDLTPSNPLYFSLDEYEERLTKTRKAMTASGVDVLFVEDPSNIAWLTGYDGWSFYVHQGVIIFHDQLPIWWGRVQDARGAELTTVLPKDRVIGYKDDFVMSTTSHPMQNLAAILKEHGHGRSRIGVEMENYYFSARAFQCLQEEMDDAVFIDATALVNWQRMIKSETELEYMRKASSISEQVIKRVVELIKPGLRKNELVANIYYELIRGNDNAWGDYPAIVPLLPSGVNASAPHLTWDDQEFKAQEGTFLELSGCYRRYHAPLCRTVYLGNPDEKFLNAEKALREGLEEGMAVAKPGATAGDIARALYGVLEKYGIKREGRCGYPVGLSYPPDWGERTLSFRTTDKTVLMPGMTFHFMPGLWMDDWGMETTETIVINKEGSASSFSTTPRQLFVKD